MIVDAMVDDQSLTDHLHLTVLVWAAVVEGVGRRSEPTAIVAEIAVAAVAVATVWSATVI